MLLFLLVSFCSFLDLLSGIKMGVEAKYCRAEVYKQGQFVRCGNQVHPSKGVLCWRHPTKKARYDWPEDLAEALEQSVTIGESRARNEGENRVRAESAPAEAPNPVFIYVPVPVYTQRRPRTNSAPVGPSYFYLDDEDEEKKEDDLAGSEMLARFEYMNL